MIKRVVAVVVIAVMIVGAAGSMAWAVSGAGFTTTANGSKVNANQYADKCDVYINGGPNNGVSNLTDGTYFFAVLAPGGQRDPNDGSPKNLSDDFDARNNRRFTVSGGHIVTNLGSHESHPDPSTTTISNDILIQLCPFANTPNPGGVYILAICLLPSPSSTATVEPRDCKYDAFKIKQPGRRGADLAATKDATPRLTRTHLWTITKSVDRTTVTTSASTATFNYAVVVTHTGVTDSGWQVTGQIQVFNVNSSTVTGVVVTDATNVGGTCVVTPGPTSIAATDSATYNYTCTFASNPGSGINTATITWDKSSINSPNSQTTATAPFNFANATVTNVNEAVHINDTIVNNSTGLPVASGQIGICTAATSPCTFNYQRILSVPASGCVSYTNTAVIVETGQQDQETVTVCRTVIGGFTMGFWQNKNGQAKIASANNVPGSGLCSYLDQFNNVLADFNGGAGCSDSYVQSYVTQVIESAEASGTGEPMFKGQFLATALSAFFDPALASASVQVPGSLLAEVDNCMTVSELLTRADSLYNTLKADKDNLMVVKDVFDGINNNIAVTC